jgi:hypothetical protein
MARTAGRTIRKSPVPASTSSALPKINGSVQRRRKLIMWGSTTAQYLQKARLVIASAVTYVSAVTYHDSK